MSLTPRRLPHVGIAISLDRGNAAISLLLERSDGVVGTPIAKHMAFGVVDVHTVLVVHVEPDSRHVPLDAVGRLETG